MTHQAQYVTVCVLHLVAMLSLALYVLLYKYVCLGVPRRFRSHFVGNMRCD